LAECNERNNNLDMTQKRMGIASLLS